MLVAILLLSMERLALGPGHGEFEPTNYAATMIAGGLDGAIASKVGPLGKFASSTLVGGVGGQAIDDAIESEREWIMLRLDNEEDLPKVTDANDIDIKEGEQVRNIGAIIKLMPGWEE